MSKKKPLTMSARKAQKLRRKKAREEKQPKFELLDVPKELEEMNKDHMHVDDEGVAHVTAKRLKVDNHKPTTFQKNFVNFYLANGGHAGKAARQAGSTSKNPIQVGYDTKCIPWVSHQIEVGMDRLTAQVNLTPSEVIEGLRETVLEARADGKYDAAIKGYQLLGTQLGMFITKTESKVTRRVISENHEEKDKLQKLSDILSTQST